MSDTEDKLLQLLENDAELGERTVKTLKLIDRLSKTVVALRDRLETMINDNSDEIADMVDTQESILERLDELTEQVNEMKGE